MAKPNRRTTRRANHREANSIRRRNRGAGRAPHHHRVALALQGGGALGAYQAGVFQALDEAGVTLDRVAGVSIGAINAAIIAGNAPKRRLERLDEFWRTISSNPGWVEPPVPDALREAFSEWSSNLTVVAGRPGFFEPRVPPPWLFPPKLAHTTSYYDTSPLKATLERLVDFDRLNEGPVHLTVGAVDVLKGNYEWFDSSRGRRPDRVGPEHIMASGALPPGFPPVAIDGAWYWDGGIVSNTPLFHILEDYPRVGTLVFQIDLFSARGPEPKNLADVMERHKDISYSSRTRMLTDLQKRLYKLRKAVNDVLEWVPKDKAGHPSTQRLHSFAHAAPTDIVHLIYRTKYDETSSKDYEFSLASMQERWRSGYADTRLALDHPTWMKPMKPGKIVRTHDPQLEEEKRRARSGPARG